MIRFATLRQKFPLMALFSLYAYLAFHAFSGSQGVLRWMQYSDQAEKLTAKAEKLEAEREALQSKVDALSADSLDLDVLDETARQVLNVSDPKEVTIWLDVEP